MSEKIFVTKEYLDQQRDKISLLEKELAETIREKELAYNEDTNAWHDNFSHEEAVRIERMLTKKLAESISDLKNMKICDCFSSSCGIVALWSKIKIIEKNLATQESAQKDIVMVPMGADNIKGNMYNYLSPYVKELVGKKQGDIVEIKLPSGRFELEILEIKD